MNTANLNRFSIRCMKLTGWARKQNGSKPDPEVDALIKKLDDLWGEAYRLKKSRLIAQAEKADKGIELFTVYRPGVGGNAIEETRRTPHRSIRRYYWKHSWYPGGLEASSDPDVDVAIRPADEYFRELMGGTA